MKQKEVLKIFFEYTLLIVGGVLLGVGVGSVLLPVKLSTGGFSGIATLLYYLFKIPASVGIVLLNIPAFIITWKILGVKYGIRSFIGMIACSLGIKIGETMGVLTTDYMLAALYGGVVSGIGIALTYLVNGSTGGTDLIAKLIHVKKPYMNLGQILLLVDGTIIVTLAFTFNSMEIILYSIISVVVMTKVLDMMLEGIDFAKGVFIITNKGNEISKFIHDEIGRTTTKINAEGTYTHEEREVLLCVVNKKEIPKLKEGIIEIDDKAFTIVTTVTEAIGKGFKNGI